jgi:hypothetical protein
MDTMIAKKMDTTPKAQALEALSTARKMLESPEPLAGVRLVQLRGLPEYSEEQVVAIAEVKRPRRAKVSGDA